MDRSAAVSRRRWAEPLVLLTLDVLLIGALIAGLLRIGTVLLR